MGNLSGWGLTGRLIGKHFGNLGNTVSEAIAEFDPETATSADRDQLRAKLQEAAQKLAAAHSAFNKEHDELAKLQNLVDTDARSVDDLVARHAAGQLSDADLSAFCDELEANRARLPQEQQQANDAQAYMNELQKIVDALSAQLSGFDAQAKRALAQLNSARAEKDLQQLRQEQQQELSDLQGMAGHSSALEALSRRAQEVSNEAAGMKIVGDITQTPLDAQHRLDAIRSEIAHGTAPLETPVERLKRLATAPAPAA